VNAAKYAKLETMLPMFAKTAIKKFNLVYLDVQ